MTDDVKYVLAQVQSGGITPEEGQRRLRALTAPGPSEPTGARPARPASLPPAPAIVADGGSLPAPTTQVAVIGMACRFPGAESPRALWRNLVDGVCSIREVPADRWDADAYYDRDPRTAGRTNSRWGGFVEDVAGFDPLVFNLSGREAERMDPQQRLFLEASWNALEDAGYGGDTMSGTSCGVFAGAPASDYARDSQRSGEKADAQTLLGNDSSILAARISYLLNLRGPSIALNTACSSSLVAIQLAVRAIEAGECQTALAGGVCLFIGPGFHIAASKGGMLSPGGLCKAFDHRADGFVPGDGVGVVMLKALDAAERDGDDIRGVILGVGTNQDGKSNGITAPNGQAQSALQLAVYRRARVDPASITMVEAHGTGTALGDPIEVEALTRSFSEFTDRRQFCAIGSVKTNIGHTGQAAGVAGVIKTLLAFEHETIPASLHFEAENERIGFVGTPFFVPTSAVEWPRTAGVPRRAAVSAFGYSGTNAHLVLQEAPHRVVRTVEGPHLVLVSALTDEALEQKLADLGEWLAVDAGDRTLDQVAFTLHAGRRHFARRAAFAVRDLNELRVVLRRRAETGPIPGSPARPGSDRVGLITELARELAATAGDPQRRLSVLQRAALLYEQGLVMDPALFHAAGDGARISLPTYPFARERHWLREQETLGLGAATPGSDLGLVRLSDPGPGKYLFRWNADLGSALIADHVVAGRAILAGMVSLELARVAAARAGRPELTGLRQVVWSRPIEVTSDGVDIALHEDETGLRFEIGRAGGRPGVTGRLSVSGPVAAAPPVTATGEPVDRAGCYQRFSAAGFTYGPAFQVLQEVRAGENEVLARLELPEETATVPAPFELHPVLLDGALQALIGLGGDQPGHTYLPHSLQFLDVHTPLRSPCRVHITRREDVFDLRLLDESGAVLVSMRGLAVAGAGATTGPAPNVVVPAASSIVRLRPVWRTHDRDDGPGIGPVLLVDLTSRGPGWAPPPGAPVTTVGAGTAFAALDTGGYRLRTNSETDYGQLLALQPGLRRIVMLIDDADAAFDAVFALTRALLLQRLSGPVSLRIGYRAGADLDTRIRALGAFARTARLENPDLRMQTVELPPVRPGEPADPKAWNLLLRADDPADPVEVRLDGQARVWRRELEELAGPAPTSGLRVQRGGTYVITGGNGHLGTVLAGHFAAQGANLVLVGRGDSAASLTLRPGSGVVVQERADVADEREMAQVLARTRARFGRLNGVVHAAGCLRDSFLLHKSANDAAAVLRAKVDGGLVLDRLTGGDQLDFLVFCSSVVAVAGNPGQADYAYANAVLDELAGRREARRAAGEPLGRTLSIGWSGWAGGGMATATETPGPGLTAEEGLASFDAALGCDEPHLLVVKGDPVQIRARLGIAAGADPAAREAGPAAPVNQMAQAQPAAAAGQNSPLSGADRVRLAESVLAGVLAEELRVPVERIDPAQPLEIYGIDSVMVMQLSKRLEDDFGPLPKTLFFEYQSLGELAGYFADRYGEALTRLATPAAERPQGNQTPAADGEIISLASASPAEPRTTAPSVPVTIIGSVAGGSPDGSVADDDIAVIGISGRYPMAPDLDAYWSNLVAGRDCVSEIPEDRWALAGFYDSAGGPGRSYTKWGGFLDDVAAFDSLFFGISPKEAEMMDPQERLFLESVWHLLEDAGYTRAGLAGGSTGVFVGVMYGQYQLLAPAPDGRMGVSSYASIANRVSYFFDFHGPSLALDTMCSSSLTAIHLACESLRRGEIDTAVAGGVNLSLHPQKYLQLSLTGFASTDGRCRSFGEGGDGYVPGEGVGALLLKPLRAAIAAGDQVHAVIKGSAINHGGKTNGYTVPNLRAQASAVSGALQAAGLEPGDIGYVEAHGTGTPLGDPIEIAALTKAFTSASPLEPVPVGSVKSMIGHLESAAGIAAVTKVILQMRHRTLVPSLHAENINVNIDFASSPFLVQSTVQPWRPRSGRGNRLAAGVSSFGAGGANAHLVLEKTADTAVAEQAQRPELIVLSAKTPDALRALAGRLAAYLEPDGAADPAPNGAPDPVPVGAPLTGALLADLRRILGLREEDLGADDDLAECGFDDVARAGLEMTLARDHAIPVERLPGTAATVTELADHLVRAHPDAVHRRFAGAAGRPTTGRPTTGRPTTGGPTTGGPSAGGQQLSLQDVAFTLQTGREAMAWRAAFVAEDIASMTQALHQLAAGTSRDGMSLGRPDPGGRPEFADPAGRQYLQTLLQDRSLSRLGEVWAAGADLDWAPLHTGRQPRRVSLVGYPFARDRHWLPSVVPAPAASAVPAPAASATAPARDETPATAAPVAGPEAEAVQRATEATDPPAVPVVVADDGMNSRAWLEGRLTSFAAATIGLEESRLDPKVSLTEYGFESLALKQVADTFSAQLGVRLSPVVFYERPGVAGAVDWLLEEFPEEIEAAFAVASAAPAPAPEVTAPAPPALPPTVVSAPADPPPLAEPPTPAEPQAPAPVPAPSSVVPTSTDRDLVTVTEPHVRDRAAGSGEPIAVIGMSARFPGSPDPDRFWQNLEAGRNLITEVPATRWDWQAQGEGMPAAQRQALRWGGFIDDVDAFDPRFFGISPAEAELMDPQQRVLLQSVWAAIEDAGYRASQLAGQKVGLFAGIQFSDYQHLLQEAGVLNVHVALGNEHSIAVNRISYLLDLRGPSEPVNTACSSSLVAVHRAVRSLRSGESTVAIAGGIALNLAPQSAVADAMMGVMSPEGQTRTLDRAANGFAKGEGVGVLVLKPLAQARADGDHVHAVIRGTAVNHGGKAASLTAPSSEAQAAVIRAAVEDADVDPATIGYVELHGTGTELGDPVEFNGLRSAFRQLYRVRGAKMPTEPQIGIGSVKSNVGHLEPASGMAGLVKVILAMRHQTLPGTVHYNEPNPYVDLDRGPFYVVGQTRPWVRANASDGSSAPLRAGVSAFGFGGSNAHVLLEEPDARPTFPPSAGAAEQIFTFSAKNTAALDRMITRFADQLDAWQATPDGSPPADSVAFTLANGREQFAERLAVIAPDLAALNARLHRVITGEDGVPDVYRGGTGSALIALAEDEQDDLRVRAAHWSTGGSLDLTEPSGSVAQRCPLPTYPFDTERFWFTAPQGQPAVKAAPAGIAGPTAMAAPLPSEQAHAVDVHQEVLAILADRLKLEPAEIGPDLSFRELGVDSLLSVGITQSLQDAFGTQVPFSALVDHPTLRQLVTYLEQHHRPRPAQHHRPPATAPTTVPTTQEPRPDEPVRLPREILPLNAAGTQQTSFWVPGAVGYAASLQNLSRALGPDYPFYAFQTRGTDGHSMPQSLEEMVEHYLYCIRLVQPQGPYVIGGYSFGGLIAMELARRLHEQGETIRHLIMFDTYPAKQEVFDLHNQKYDDDFMSFYMTNYFLDLRTNPELAIRQEDLAHLPRSLHLPELARLAKEKGNKRVPVEDIYSFLSGGLVCAEHSSGIYQTYKMRHYNASDVLFFKASDGFTGASSEIYWRRTNILENYDYVSPWREYIGADLRLVELENDHLNMLEEPTLSQALREIAPLLRDESERDLTDENSFAVAFEAVSEFGRELLAGRIGASGAFEDGALVTRAQVRAHLRVLPAYERFVDACLDILVRQGRLVETDEGLRATALLGEATTTSAEIEARAEALALAHPEIAGHLPLLLACQAGLLEVVAGAADANDLMFPGGSMRLVEELYRADPQTNHANQVIASRVTEEAARFARRYPRSNAQIMEIGAGTGGTSENVLNALDDHTGRLQYLYTDLAAPFVRAARATFGPDHPFAEFETYDIEREPEAQGFEPHGIDVLIAANILSSTRTVGGTLQQCRRLLKPGGKLVLTELTSQQDYTTLTFGMTASLWRFEDPQVRIAGSPLLGVDGWTQALTTAGFVDVEVVHTSGPQDVRAVLVATNASTHP